ncbi:Protein of uncharacterised function (DUF3170) [Burkholderia pseudomallei]|nr:Protein of uncharacterised function (DUF3170) [Burkholderia pseudomallei]VBN25178.1 Protein of uncharacterised function (DUF3170) [Burkholderia pseudomallei]
MPLLEFAHVDDDDRALVAEQRIGDRERGLGLAGARRPREQEHAERAARIVDAGRARLHGFGDLFDRVILAADAAAQRIGEPQHHVRAIAAQLAGRDAGPVGHDVGDRVRIDVDSHERRVALRVLEAARRFGERTSRALARVGVRRAQRGPRPRIRVRGDARARPGGHACVGVAGVRAGFGIGRGGVGRIGHLGDIGDIGNVGTIGELAGMGRSGRSSRIRCSRCIRRRPARAACVDERLRGVALRRPRVAQRAGARGQRGELAIDVGDARRIRRAALGQFVAQRAPLALERLDRALRVLQRGGLGLLAHLHARARGVEQVDRLVRQLPAGDVARRQLGRGDERVVADRHAVRVLIALLQPAQDHHRRRDVRAVELHRLEAPRERRVLLEILLVFAPRGGRDRAQLAARERGLQQVRRVGRARRAARADQRVRFVDEQHDGRLRRADLGDHALEPLLEFALHARARLQHAEVEAEQRRAAQRRRHVAFGDPQREPFDDGRLAHARLADAHRIVLAPPREDVDDLADFRVATEDRIDPAGARFRGEVLAVAGDRARCVARVARLARRGVERAGRARFDRSRARAARKARDERVLA